MSSSALATLSRGVLMCFLRLRCKRGRQKLHWVAHTACMAWGSPSLTAVCSHWSSLPISFSRACGITSTDWESLQHFYHLASILGLNWIKHVLPIFRCDSFHTKILYGTKWDYMTLLPLWFSLQLERKKLLKIYMGWLWENYNSLLKPLTVEHF